MDSNWKYFPFLKSKKVFFDIKTIFFFLFFVVTSNYNSNAQENCGNGIDDDGDGLIDCLDPDCTGNPPSSSFFNTANNGSGGALPGGSQDLSWKVSSSFAGPYTPAYVMNSIPGGYYSSPWPSSRWISYSQSGYHSYAGGPVDYYFKISFLLPCFNPCGLSYSTTGVFCLTLDYFADNSVYEIWVNGVPQSSSIGTIPVANPYYNAGYASTGRLTASLCQNWQPGLNELIVRVSSGPDYIGLLVQSSVNSLPVTTASINGSTTVGTTTGDTTTVCQNDPEPNITFTGSGTAPFTITYNINNGVNQTVISNGNTVTVPAPTSTPGTFTYSLLSVQDANSVGCPNAIHDNAIVIVNPLPQTDAGNNQTICTGTSILLTASGGTSYQWAGGPASDVYTVTPVSTTVYTVTAYLNGCSASDDITITVNPLPTINVFPNHASICEGDSIALTASGASAYNWSPSFGLSDNTGSIVTAAPTTKTTYMVSGNLNGCYNSSSIVVNVDSLFTVNIGTDTVICPDSVITLNAGKSGSTYFWSTGETTRNISVSSQGIYWVNVAKGTCAASDSINVSLLPKLNLGGDVSLCNKTEVMLSSDIAASSYLWSTGQTSPEIIIKQPGIFWLTVDIHNCRMADTINITSGFTSFYIANAFTPNKDGLNDNFILKGEGIASFDMKIFNRWGENIFETKDLNSGWDGTYKGENVNIGLYVWVINYSTICSGDMDLQKIGSVMLLK